MAGGHRLHTGQRPCPVPGDRGLDSFPLRGNEPAERTGGRSASVAALWSRPVRQIVPPRTPAMPEAGPLGIPETGTLEVIAATRTPRQSLRLVSRRPQRRRCSGSSVACAVLVARRGSGQRVRQRTHRSPPTAPPSTGEGDLMEWTPPPKLAPKCHIVGLINHLNR